ncbi:hypothetical protein D3C81_1531550 [compost metagenome]
MSDQQPVKDQIADNHRRENRDLPDAIFKRRQPEQLDQQQWRQADPGDQRQAHQPQRQTGGEESAIAEQGAITLASLAQGETHGRLLVSVSTGDADGFRHPGKKPQPDHRRGQTQPQKQFAPRQPLQQQNAQ